MLCLGKFLLFYYLFIVFKALSLPTAVFLCFFYYLAAAERPQHCALVLCSISMVYIIQNPKIPDFCKKWVPKLKIAISQKHILEYNMRNKHARKLKIGQVRGKNDWKKLYDSDFSFPASFWLWLCMLLVPLEAFKDHTTNPLQGTLSRGRTLGWGGDASRYSFCCKGFRRP